MFDKIISEKILKGESPKNAKARTRAGTVGTCVGICLNLVLSLSKCLVGIFTSSVAILADGINNFSDMAGSAASLFSIRVAGKPGDKKHPYGHGRMEYVGALLVGMLILMLSFSLLTSGVKSLMNPEKMEFSWISALVVACTLPVKTLMYFFYNSLGKKIDSASLRASAKDSLSDLVATSGVLLSVIFSPMTSLPLDGIIGIAVSLLVAKEGFSVIIDTVNLLLGGEPDPELERAIEEKVASYKPIEGTHDLMIHDYGPGRCFASIHAEVPSTCDLVTIHEVVDRAEREIGEEMHIPLCIHIDPMPIESKSLMLIRQAVEEELGKIDSRIELHDMRIVYPAESDDTKEEEETHPHLKFDLDIPANYQNDESKQKINQVLNSVAAKIAPGCHCVIHFRMLVV